MSSKYPHFVFLEKKRAGDDSLFQFLAQGTLHLEHIAYHFDIKGLIANLALFDSSRAQTLIRRRMMENGCTVLPVNEDRLSPATAKTLLIVEDIVSHMGRNPPCFVPTPSQSLDFALLQSPVVGKRVDEGPVLEWKIRVTNSSYTNYKTFTNTFSSPCPEDWTFSYSLGSFNFDPALGKPLFVNKGQSVIVKVSVRPRSAGNHICRLTLGTREEPVFVYLHAFVAPPLEEEVSPGVLVATKDGDETIESILSKRVWDGQDRTVIESPIKNLASFSHRHTELETTYERHLEEYPLPQEIYQQIIKSGDIRGLYPWNVEPAREKSLRTLLFVEEAFERMILEKYNLSGISFPDTPQTKKDDIAHYYVIPVESLSENRPSVIKGDLVHIWENGTCDKEWQGTVTYIFNRSIEIGIDPTFSAQPRLTSPCWNVRFELPRIMYRAMHRTIFAENINKIYQPFDAVVSKRLHQGAISRFSGELGTIDRLRGLSEEQRSAVRSIVFRQHGNVPFTLMGPFGTGKTKTLVEAIRLLLLHTEAKILVCSRSNQAADKILSDLIGIFTGTNEAILKGIFRLYSMHNNGGKNRETFKRFTFYDAERKLFIMPDKHFIMKKRLVISTCSSSAQIYGVGVDIGHFSHIIVDEAGQLHEPEALMTISLASRDTSIVLAGDEKQLGPRLFCPSAKHNRLGKSVIQVLADNRHNIDPAYNKSEFVLSVKLNTNFRVCNKELLDLSSRWFYDGKLKMTSEPRSDFGVISQGWLGINGFVDHPFLFVDIKGQQQDCEDIPSFKNTEEADEIVAIVNQLSRRIDPNSIAIVSPFFGQVKAIKRAFSATSAKSGHIGPPTGIQGLEFEVVIVSTVRTSSVDLVSDEKFDLGFIGNDKRLCTVMSRAKSLFIVVGDSETLQVDHRFKDFIGICKKKGSFHDSNKERLSVTHKVDLPSYMTGPPTPLDIHDQNQFPDLVPKKVIITTKSGDAIQIGSSSSSSSSSSSTPPGNRSMRPAVTIQDPIRVTPRDSFSYFSESSSPVISQPAKVQPAPVVSQHANVNTNTNADAKLTVSDPVSDGPCVTCEKRMGVTETYLALNLDSASYVVQKIYTEIASATQYTVKIEGVCNTGPFHITIFTQNASHLFSHSFSTNGQLVFRFFLASTPRTVSVFELPSRDSVQPVNKAPVSPPAVTPSSSPMCPPLPSSSSASRPPLATISNSVSPPSWGHPLPAAIKPVATPSPLKPTAAAPSPAPKPVAAVLPVKPAMTISPDIEDGWVPVVSKKAKAGGRK